MIKKLTICVGLCLMASPAYAALKKDDVKRLNDSAAVLAELRHAPDRSIPENLWDKAACVLVFPSVKKGAFVIGGEYGAGVMSCRRASGSGRGWSAPVFMHLATGSLGLQIGAEEVDFVLLVMNARGVDKLLEDKVTLGADASIAAGPVGRSGAAATDAQLNAQLLSVLAVARPVCRHRHVRRRDATRHRGRRESLRSGDRRSKHRRRHWRGRHASGRAGLCHRACTRRAGHERAQVIRERTRVRRRDCLLLRFVLERDFGNEGRHLRALWPPACRSNRECRSFSVEAKMKKYGVLVAMVCIVCGPRVCTGARRRRPCGWRSGVGHARWRRPYVW